MAEPDSPATFDDRFVRALRRGEPGYGEARDALSWNRRLADARSPAAIVAVRSANEAAAAVRLARDNGLQVSPRGGGHSYQAAALRDDCLLLDLAQLGGIEVNRRTACVGAGVRGGVLLETLEPYGLAFPIGHCADVALSGYVLSGGFGWNSGNWGPASANVEAIEMVLADGRIVVATPGEHPDLFWAARGAGAGFFAVVTAYRLRLHDLPAAAHSLTAAWRVESAPALADWLTQATRAAPQGVEIAVLVGPQHETGEPAVALHASASGATAAEAREKVAAFASPPAEAEAIGHPRHEDLCFAELTRISAMPDGKRVAADHLWSEAPVGELLMAVRHLAAVPDKASTINIFALGGDGRVALPPDEHGSALSLGGGTGVGIYALWDDPADDARHVEWVRAVDAALTPCRTGRYVGEADLTAGPERRAECFTPAALERLEALRREYDPDGLFPRWP